MKKEYENGFYIYKPKSGLYFSSGLSVPQVIEIIEGEIWVTGMEEVFSIGRVERVGTIGRMVMTQGGEELWQHKY